MSNPLEEFIDPLFLESEPHNSAAIEGNPSAEGNDDASENNSTPAPSDTTSTMRPTISHKRSRRMDEDDEDEQDILREVPHRKKSRLENILEQNTTLMTCLLDFL